MSEIKITYLAYRDDSDKYLHLSESERPYTHQVEAVDEEGNTVWAILNSDLDKSEVFRIRGNEKFRPSNFDQAELTNGRIYINAKTDRKKFNPVLFYDYNGLQSFSRQEDMKTILNILHIISSEPLHFSYGNNEEELSCTIYREVMTG